MTVAEQYGTELAAIAAQLHSITVQVRGHRSGVGSGVIWRSDGLIVTNAHVVPGAIAEVELADGRTFRAQVKERNWQRDLVALQVQASELPAAAIGDSDQLRVGELVLAMGHPHGQRGALTTGMVHRVGASTSRSWIQTDVQLAPGNSGGPLANAQGQIIGLNTMIVGGKGFAIPSRVIQQFLQTPAEQPYLGVMLQPVRVPALGRRSVGLLITAIEPDSPAAAANLLPGDIVIGLRGRRFRHPGELFHTLTYANSGDGLPLLILRGTQSLTVDVVLWGRTSNSKIA